MKFSDTIDRPQPNSIASDKLRVGLTCEYQREVTADDILQFAENSGDWNPLHVDEDYATTTNYSGCIAHGAFQIGLASALAGMHLPGRNVLVTAVSGQFPAPLQFPTRVRVQGEITAWNPQFHCGNLRVRIADTHTGISTADVVVTFSYHDQRHETAPADQAVRSRPQLSSSATRTVILTGASGGIGEAIADHLATDYRVLAIANRHPPSRRSDQPNIEFTSLNLCEPNWHQRLEETLQQTPIYAVVHCAWPGLVRGGLLSTPRQTLRDQLDFGSVHVVDLARLLVRHKQDGPGRLIAIGSTLGTKRPLAQHAAYSLGKAALEHTIQLLAAELGAQQITANAICPSFVPVGMNANTNDRQLELTRAHVPVGRLCETQDVAQAVSWLLSDQASFVSGQMLHLSGGQLGA